MVWFGLVWFGLVIVFDTTEPRTRGNPMPVHRFVSNATGTLGIMRRITIGGSADDSTVKS